MSPQHVIYIYPCVEYVIDIDIRYKRLADVMGYFTDMDIRYK